MTKKKKTDTPFVINPITNRSVRVGGKVYNNLVRQGYFKDEYVDDKILEEFEETENMKLMKDKIEELDDRLPVDLHAVRGRGRYQGKLVKRYRKRPKAPKAEPEQVISAERAQARQEAQRQQQLTETIPAMAKAAKDVSAAQQPQE